MLRAQERLLVLTVLFGEEQVWASETRRTPSSQYVVIVDQRIETIVCIVASGRQTWPEINEVEVGCRGGATRYSCLWLLHVGKRRVEVACGDV